MRKTYRGREIEVTFDLDVCVHVGQCFLGLPEVFDLDRRAWVLPDAADADTVAEIVERCPSGALMYRRLDGGPDEQAPNPPSITSVENGPLLVRGAVEVRLPDGTTETWPRATLCRCGFSENKPFCDNSHLTNAFEAPGERIKIRVSPVRPAPERPIERRDDPRG